MRRRMMMAAAGAAVDDVATFVSVAHSAFDAKSLSLTNNDPVSTWTNEGTTGGDATSTSTARPTYIASRVGANGQPVLQFDGSNDRIGTSTFAELSQPNTYIAVAKDNSPAHTRDILGGNTATKRNNIGLLNTDEYFIFSGSAEESTVMGGDTNWHIFVCVFDGASSRLYVDGGADIISTNPGSEGINSLSIGSNHVPGEFWDGDIHFIGIYDGDLYTDDLAQLNATCQALANRIGTAWTDIT